jgi:hypothetical protein
MEEEMSAQVISTQQKYPRIFSDGITHIVHISGDRGGMYTFYRNNLGRVWFAVGNTPNSRPPHAMQQVAEEAIRASIDPEHCLHHQVA